MRQDGLEPDALVALAARCHGLLAHGTGRLTSHTIGGLLGADVEADAPARPKIETIFEGP